MCFGHVVCVCTAMSHLTVEQVDLALQVGSEGGSAHMLCVQLSHVCPGEGGACGVNSKANNCLRLSTQGQDE